MKHKVAISQKYNWKRIPTEQNEANTWQKKFHPKIKMSYYGILFAFCENLAKLELPKMLLVYEKVLQNRQNMFFPSRHRWCHQLRDLRDMIQGKFQSTTKLCVTSYSCLISQPKYFYSPSGRSRAFLR